MSRWIALRSLDFLALEATIKSHSVLKRKAASAVSRVKCGRVRTSCNPNLSHVALRVRSLKKRLLQVRKCALPRSSIVAAFSIRLDKYNLTFIGRTVIIRVELIAVRDIAAISNVIAIAIFLAFIR